jgi:transcriptional regulator with XRE-family HTH domain
MAIEAETIDPLVFGHRLRHYRRKAGLTLQTLGARVDRPAPYLSQLENGHVEPKIGLLNQVAGALDCSVADLLEQTPPNRRAELEIAVERYQQEPSYSGLALPILKPTAKVPDDVLEHIVALYRAYVGSTRPAAEEPSADEVLVANARLRTEMRERSNYYGEIEAVAAAALRAANYSGFGPISERTLIDLADHFGFRVDRVQDLPRSARSVTDLINRIIYIPQRNEMPTRSARSVVLSTLGHFALEHSDPKNVGDYLRQRVESNYFAGAVLAPEAAAVPFLREAMGASDISAEDLKEVFYISYEMASHRITNLATRHLGIPVHFLRTDDKGVISKAYENDGVPLPVDSQGALEGRQVPAGWGPRQVFRSDDTYSLHYQYTETSAGTFWCVTHVEAAHDTPNALTLGTDSVHARHFRGSDTERYLPATASEDQAAALDPGLADAWAGNVWPSARDREFVLGGTTEGAFGPFPGVEMDEVHWFLHRHTDS